MNWREWIAREDFVTGFVTGVLSNFACMALVLVYMRARRS